MKKVGKAVCLAAAVSLAASSPLSAGVVSDNASLALADPVEVFEVPTYQASLDLIPDFALDGSSSTVNLMLIGQSAGGAGTAGSGAAGAAGAGAAGAGAGAAGGVTGLVVGIVAAIAVAVGITKAATASDEPISA